MIILWLAILSMLAWKFPVFTAVLVFIFALTAVSILMFVRFEEKKKREKYYLAEFNQEMLDRKLSKGNQVPLITKGQGIHIYRFMRDPKTATSKAEEEANYLGGIEFNSYNKYFTVDIPILGEFHEILILNSKTLTPVKIIPSSNSLTISCDRKEFNSVYIEEGKYLIWIRALGPSASIDNLKQIFASRSKLATNIEEPATIYSDAMTNPEGLKDLSIDCHHDNHQRLKIAEYQSREFNIFPRSPYIKAYQVEAKLAKDEIVFIFLENSRLRTLFHSLYIGGIKNNIFLTENRSQMKLTITYDNLREIDKNLDEVSIVYTQFLHDAKPFKENDFARPFITRYSKARSHFWSDEAEENGEDWFEEENQE